MTLNYEANLPNKHSQKGATLVVGLLILLLATLVSVSAMTDSNLQEKMAANAQNTNRAFQAAESAIESNLTSIEAGSLTVLTQAINVYLNGSGTLPTSTVSLADSDISANVQFEVVGLNHPPGQTLNAEEGTNNLTSYTFQMTSEVTLSGSSAETTAVQGFFYN
jgi:type IV pilus assembly protein PilX